MKTKMPIEWHEECLKNMRNTEKEYFMRRISAINQHDKLISAISFAEYQEVSFFETAGSFNSVMFEGITGETI